MGLDQHRNKSLIVLDFDGNNRSLSIVLKGARVEKRDGSVSIIDFDGEASNEVMAEYAADPVSDDAAGPRRQAICRLKFSILDDGDRGQC